MASLIRGLEDKIEKAVEKRSAPIALAVDELSVNIKALVKVNKEISKKLDGISKSLKK